MYRFELSSAFIFLIVSGTINILVLLYEIGFLKTESPYLVIASIILRFFIGIILVITYNPYYPLRKRFKDFDNKIAYSAGLYITIVSLLNVYNIYVLKKIKMIT
jgi:hypothetical protein